MLICGGCSQLERGATQHPGRTWHYSVIGHRWRRVAEDPKKAGEGVYAAKTRKITKTPNSPSHPQPDSPPDPPPAPPPNTTRDRWLSRMGTFSKILVAWIRPALAQVSWWCMYGWHKVLEFAYDASIGLSSR